MKSRKIIITGATGMLGGVLMAELIRSGYKDLTILVRPGSDSGKLEKTLDREGIAKTDRNYNVIEVALNNPVELKAALIGSQLVFHCAAAVVFDEKAEDIIFPNIEITAHMVDAASACKTDLFVHVSSIAALGTAQEGSDYIYEKDRLESIGDQSPYAKSKFLSENQVLRGQETGLNTIIIQPAVILGEGDWNSSGSAALIPVISSGMPISTNGVTGYVDVRDVAKAMVALSEVQKAVGESFILCADNISFRKLIEMGAQAAGKKKPIFNAGAMLTGMAWRAERFASMVNPKHNIKFTRAAAKSALSKHLYCGDKIKDFINFAYTPLNETVRRVVGQYIKDQNK